MKTCVSNIKMSRNLRRESFQDYDAIIFVVDSADRHSFTEARDELWKFLSFAPDLMEHPVILILANKQGGMWPMFTFHKCKQALEVFINV